MKSNHPPGKTINHSTIFRVLKNHRLVPILIGIMILTGIFSCSWKVINPDDKYTPAFRWFPELVAIENLHRNGLYFIPGLKSYQQTTEYTCGPAVLLAISLYYQKPGIKANRETEMQIALEAGTRKPDVFKEQGKPGTQPHEMKKWLETHGFDVKLEYENRDDGSALQKLKENTIKQIPTIIEWADLTGHWAIVVGYDTRNNSDPWDDVIILADSYDRYDDYQDGYSFINANRFYWLWFDAFYFEAITWRTMITAVPKP